MLNLKVVPPYPQLKRNDEYTLILDSKDINFSSEIFYFSLPESLQALSECLQELGEVCQVRSEIDSLTDGERLQYFIFQDLMQVDLVDKRLIFRAFAPHIYDLYPDIVESIEYKLQENPMLKPIGKVWFAGESRWPYIGYLPLNQQILISQPNWGREDNPRIWFSNPFPLQVFIESVSSYLHGFDGTDLEEPLKPVFATLAQLPHILSRS